MTVAIAPADAAEKLCTPVESAEDVGGSKCAGKLVRTDIHESLQK
jgi:hypothetical protein